MKVGFFNAMKESNYFAAQVPASTDGYYRDADDLPFPRILFDGMFCTKPQFIGLEELERR